MLGDIALADEYEWSVNKQRLAAAHFDYWATKEGRAVLDFAAARPHLSTRRLARMLEAHGHRTPQGRPNWHPPQVSRVREQLADRNEAAALHSDAV
jgi:hypothetical protein